MKFSPGREEKQKYWFVPLAEGEKSYAVARYPKNEESNQRAGVATTNRRLSWGGEKRKGS